MLPRPHEHIHVAALGIPASQARESTASPPPQEDSIERSHDTLTTFSTLTRPKPMWLRYATGRPERGDMLANNQGAQSRGDFFGRSGDLFERSSRSGSQR